MELISYYLAAMMFWIILLCIIAYHAIQRGRSGLEWFGVSIIATPLIGLILWFIAPKLSGEAWFGLTVIIPPSIIIIVMFIMPNRMDEYWKEYKNIPRGIKKLEEKNDLPPKS